MKKLDRNSAVTIFIEAEAHERGLRSAYLSQRSAFLIKQKLRIKTRIRLAKQGASRKQLHANTKHLDRKQRQCYPRGKAWEKVADNVYLDMLMVQEGS